jgi:excisionase family DNA binding protein
MIKTAISPLEKLQVGPREAASILGISQATFFRWLAGGVLGPTGVKRGAKRLFAIDELRAWVAAGMPQRAEWQARRASEMGRANGTNHTRRK